MIEFTVASEGDKLKISEISMNQVDYHPLKEDQFSVVKEGGSILGFTSYRELNRSTAEIVCIYIIPEERGNKLGEGILRATFFHLQQRGYINILLKPNTNYNPLIERLTIGKLQEDTELFNWLQNQNHNPKDYYYCEPTEFFNRGCGGCKSNNK